MKDGLVGADDTDFFSRVMKDGGRALWVPFARVRHFVPRSRLTRSYVERWYRDAGRTVVRQAEDSSGPMVRGVPRWMLRRLIRETAVSWLWRPFQNERWFQSYRQSLILRGMIAESRLKLSRGRGN